jgi:hypothetical protein
VLDLLLLGEIEMCNSLVQLLCRNIVAAIKTGAVDMREVSPLSVAVKIAFFLPSLLKELAHLYAFMKLLLASVCQHTFTQTNCVGTF